MRILHVILLTTITAACSTPDIGDWPPTPPAVSEEIIQSYVDRYTADSKSAPIYGPEDIPALHILSERRSALPDVDDFDDADSRFMLGKLPEKSATDGKRLSRNEINAITRRVNRMYDSVHTRRHVLKGKYGID